MGRSRAHQRRVGANYRERAICTVSAQGLAAVRAAIAGSVGRQPDVSDCESGLVQVSGSALLAVFGTETQSLCWDHTVSTCSALGAAVRG